MWSQFTYSFKDVLKAARSGFALKKLTVGFIGLFVAAIFYGIFTYLGLIVSGAYFNEIWRTWHFIPIPIDEDFTFLGSFLHYLGIGGAIVVLLFTSLIIAKLTFEELRGYEFYEIGKAFRYAMNKGMPLITAPFIILLFILLILIGGFLLGFIARIPFIGKFIFALFTPLSYFAGLFIIYLVAGIIITFIFAPPVLASQEADTFDVLFESFSILNESLARAIFYEIIVIISAIIGGIILTWASVKSVRIMEYVFSSSIALGDKFSLIEKIALYYFPQSPIFIQISPFLSLIGADAIVYNAPEIPHVSTGIYLLGVFYGAMLYFLVFLIGGYVISIISSGNLIAYLVIAKHKDNIEYLKEEEYMIVELKPEESKNQ